MSTEVSVSTSTIDRFSLIDRRKMMTSPCNA